MTTFVLSMFNSNLVDGKGLPVVLGLALGPVFLVVKAGGPGRAAHQRPACPADPVLV